ncbi:hypothetical protein H2203_003804 [Taxawa tesnikishii (nom. ined.)]|nr:hypothetical protein H2203_003804 [Dothideales sp. JES 119]
MSCPVSQASHPTTGDEVQDQNFVADFTSVEALLASILQEVAQPPRPIWHVRGTHRTASQGESHLSIDFDFSFDQTDVASRHYLRILNPDLDNIDEVSEEKTLQALCRGIVDKRVGGNHRELIHTDEEAVRSYITAQCTALRYAGTLDISVDRKVSTVDIVPRDDQAQHAPRSNDITISVGWIMHWPLTVNLDVYPEKRQLQQLWRRRVGEAIINGDQGVITLDTMPASTGQSLLRKTMKQKSLAQPMSKRTDANGVTWTESRTLRWGADEV